MVFEALICVSGFFLLWFGAEWLVSGSGSLARSLGIRPIVIGLTVVAFGTSAPEFVVSVVSAVENKAMIATGNVVGSNIANIALVLGISALISPITAQRSVVRREIPIMLGASLLLLAFAADGGISRIEGGVLVAGIVLYTFSHYVAARRAGPTEITTEVEKIPTVDSRSGQLALIVAGIFGVVSGAQLVVDAAVRIMTVLNVSEKFVGLTLVAFGTSLPELATSAVAAARKEMDISVGNLVGSNVFNLLSVLGAAALIRGIPIEGGLLGSGLAVDFGVMLLTSALPLLLLGRSLRIGRGGGLILVATYVAYLAWLVVRR